MLSPFCIAPAKLFSRTELFGGQIGPAFVTTRALLSEPMGISLRLLRAAPVITRLAALLSIRLCTASTFKQFSFRHPLF